MFLGAWHGGSLSQIAADILHHRANYLNGFLEPFRSNLKFIAPVVEFVRLIDVDAAVVLPAGFVLVVRHLLVSLMMMSSRHGGPISTRRTASKRQSTRDLSAELSFLGRTKFGAKSCPELRLSMFRMFDML